MSYRQGLINYENFIPIKNCSYGSNIINAAIPNTWTFKNTTLRKMLLKEQASPWSKNSLFTLINADICLYPFDLLMSATNSILENLWVAIINLAWDIWWLYLCNNVLWNLFSITYFLFITNNRRHMFYYIITKA